MFPSLGLFKTVVCPELAHCKLSHCVFAHDKVVSTQHDFHESNDALRLPPAIVADDRPSLTSSKRRKLDGVSNVASSRQQLAAKQKDEPRLPVRLESAIRPISPPPKRPPASQSQAIARDDKSNGSGLASKKPPEASVVSLNPRLLSKPPASHAVRLQYVKLLHEQLCRLNELVRVSEDESKAALELSKQELVHEALMEEETVAKNNPVVYGNVVKLRIMRLRKMTMPDWKQERLKHLSQPQSELSVETKTKPHEVCTGLTVIQERELLSKLVANQDGLYLHGYVTKKLTSEETEKARAGVDAAQGWEQCDRCKTRFQVFPGRRAEDGTLTSGGSCTYHPARPRKPPVQGRATAGNKEAIHACCKAAPGTSAGCTTAESHVFKVNDPKRLELIMPFVQTPSNPTDNRQVPICFDCEMGYTTLGMELIRLTATSWPDGTAMLDVLIRPKGEVLDLNSRFSGVWPEDFKKAVPWEVSPSENLDTKGDDTTGNKGLRIVTSPEAARTLLFSLLSPSTPLIGHALDNDLNSVRIIHPSIIDTVLLFPHPRKLPVRFALKVLMKKHLDRDIQLGDGSAGHDSKEDARAAGDLVRWKLKEVWGKMQRDGWKVEDSTFIPSQTRADSMRAEIASLKRKSDASSSD